MRERPLFKKLAIGELLRNKTDGTADLGHLELFILICVPAITSVAMAYPSYQRSNDDLDSRGSCEIWFWGLLLKKTRKESKKYI